MEAYVGRGRGERGAILIQVAISIMALTAFTAFVVDYGVLWVARGQAQNAADAGALAGAIARAYDDTAEPPSTMIPFNSASLTARCASRSAGCPTTAPFANPVWPSQTGASPAVQVSWDCPPSLSGKCVQVDVYRDGSHGSTALPTFVGPLLGVNSQGVRATATAVVGAANATNCMTPFSLADQWVENVAPAGVFNHWTQVSGSAVEQNPHDVYVPATATDPGSGYRLPRDLGVQQTLIAKTINGGSDASGLGVGWSLSLSLPDGTGAYPSGSPILRQNIANCVGHPVHIGQYIPIQNAGVAPIRNGVADLLTKDPNARWDATTNTVQNSCAPSSNCPNVSGFVAMSPRIIAVAVFDVEDFQHRMDNNDQYPCPTGGQCVKIVNILGYFVDSVDSNANVSGYLMSYPGEYISGATTLGTSSFLKFVGLVR